MILKTISLTSKLPLNPYLGDMFMLHLFYIDFIGKLFKVFKTRLDEVVLNDLIQWVTSLPMAGGLELNDL